MSMENFSPDNCFDEMAKVLMPDREPTEVGYIELLEEVKKLKKSKEYERVSLLRKIAELKEQLEEKDAHWNDWLNKEFGDELYPISPSPEPDEFVKKMKGLKEENEKWKYWASEVIHWSHSASKNNLEAKKLITNDDKPTIANVRDFGKEIAELKEQIDELGVLCENIDENAFKTWKEITGREDHTR